MRSRRRSRAACVTPGATSSPTSRTWRVAGARGRGPSGGSRGSYATKPGPGEAIRSAIRCVMAVVPCPAGRGAGGAARADRSPAPVTSTRLIPIWRCPTTEHQPATSRPTTPTSSRAESPGAMRPVSAPSSRTRSWTSSVSLLVSSITRRSPAGTSTTTGGSACRAPRPPPRSCARSARGRPTPARRGTRRGRPRSIPAPASAASDHDRERHRGLSPQSRQVGARQGRGLAAPAAHGARGAQREDEQRQERRQRDEGDGRGQDAYGGRHREHADEQGSVGRDDAGQPGPVKRPRSPHAPGPGRRPARPGPGRTSPRAGPGHRSRPRGTA